MSAKMEISLFALFSLGSHSIPSKWLLSRSRGFRQQFDNFAESLSLRGSQLLLHSDWLRLLPDEDRQILRHARVPSSHTSDSILFLIPAFLISAPGFLLFGWLSYYHIGPLLVCIHLPPMEQPCSRRWLSFVWNPAGFCSLLSDLEAVGELLLLLLPHLPCLCPPSLLSSSELSSSHASSSPLLLCHLPSSLINWGQLQNQEMQTNKNNCYFPFTQVQYL